MNSITISQNVVSELGHKLYSLSDHRGNVNTVIADIKVPQSTGTVVSSYIATIVNIGDFSSFNVELDGRTIKNADFRYSVQGQEHHDEILGAGNYINYKYRGYDPRVGRLDWAIDLVSHEYPWYSPYQFSGNRLIDAIEREGLEFEITRIGYNQGVNNGVTTVKVADDVEFGYYRLVIIQTKKDGSFQQRTEYNAKPFGMEYKKPERRGVVNSGMAVTFYSTGEIQSIESIASYINETISPAIEEMKGMLDPIGTATSKTETYSTVQTDSYGGSINGEQFIKEFSMTTTNTVVKAEAIAEIAIFAQDPKSEKVTELVKSLGKMGYQVKLEEEEPFEGATFNLGDPNNPEGIVITGSIIGDYDYAKEVTVKLESVTSVSTGDKVDNPK